MADVDAELADLDLPADPPSAGSPPAAGPGRALWILLALLIVGLVALPLWAVVATALVLPLDVIAAEGLQHTDGFVSRPEFELAIRAVLAVNLTAVGWCVVRRIRTRRDPSARPWRPLAWLWGGYLLGIWLTAPADIFGVLDVPEEITSFFLLGAANLAGVMIPAILLLLLGRLLSTLWRSARASVRSYHRVIGLGSAIGLGAATTVGAMSLGIDAGYLDAPITAFENGIDAPDISEPLDEEIYEYYVSASGAFASREERAKGGGTVSAFARASAPTDPFAKCAHALLEPQPGEQAQAQVERAIAHVVSQWRLPRADAEDVAMEALLKTCRSYTERPRDWVVQTYWTSVKNTSQNFRARRLTRQKYEQDIGELARQWQETPSPMETLALRRMAERANAAARQLPADQREVLRLRIEELSFDAIAARLEITPETARKRLQRAKNKLECDATCSLRRRWGD